MKDITANTYALFYLGSNIGHSIFHDGVKVTEFIQGARYFKITLSNGVMKTLRGNDTLQVKNHNNFLVK